MQRLSHYNNKMVNREVIRTLHCLLKDELMAACSYKQGSEEATWVDEVGDDDIFGPAECPSPFL